jgi:hypothetical protein
VVLPRRKANSRATAIIGQAAEQIRSVELELPKRRRRGAKDRITADLDEHVQTAHAGWRTDCSAGHLEPFAFYVCLVPPPLIKPQDVLVGVGWLLVPNAHTDAGPSKLLLYTRDR